MNKILYTILLLFLVSCNIEKKKSIDELEKESLSSGVRIDTILDGIIFGTPRDNFYIRDIKDYRFDIDELHKYSFNVYPKFYNDSLYELYFSASDIKNIFLSKYSLDAIVRLFSIKYNKPDTIYQDDIFGINFHNVWLKGNLKIDIVYRESGSLSISYTDLSREIYKRGIISPPDDFSGDVYTQEYYQKVYLSRKKSELDGI